MRTYAMGVRLALMLAVAALVLNSAAACSCALSHPQTHFCNSDYVILTRVKKEITTDKERVYRTIVKKIFKATDKGSVLLMAGKIWTPLWDSMCGVQLQTNTTYLLAGHIVAGRPRLSLCSLYLPWPDVTPKQRKGFRLMYGQSCHCGVSYGRFGDDQPADMCPWETSMMQGDGPDCQGQYAICMRQPRTNRCGWTGGSRYRQCMEARLDQDP